MLKTAHITTKEMFPLEKKVYRSSIYINKDSELSETFHIQPSNMGGFHFMRVIGGKFTRGTDPSMSGFKEEAIKLAVEKICNNDNDLKWFVSEWDGEESFFASKSEKKKGGVVYFIEAVGSGFVKIGWSKNGTTRLECMQTACPHRLVLLKEINTKNNTLEKQLHRRFADYHFRGEWFHLSDEIREYLNQQPT